jgi:hypothetical protein
MATTTNYGWTTPDDTALVKDGAAAIRTLGSSVDTTTKALNPSTTLGDIEYRSSTANTNTRLGIGTTGQILTVAGGVPSWATAAGGTANWSLLNAGGTALTGAATITVSGISGKDKIAIVVDAASSASASSTISIRLNTDTGANYYTYGNRVTAGSSYSSDNIRGWAAGSDFNAIRLGVMSASTGSEVYGFCLITGCNSAGVKVLQANGGALPDGNSGHQIYNIGGYYNSASTISSISVFSASGNFDAGTVYVYTSA